MLKNFFKICVLFLVMMSVQLYNAEAADLRYNAGEPLKAIAGKILKIKMDINRLYVEDEFSGETFDFFVHEHQLAKLAIGDRVRVYYHSLRLPAVNVVKMTVLEYNEKKQNQGYIFRKN